METEPSTETNATTSLTNMGALVSQENEIFYEAKSDTVADSSSVSEAASGVSSTDSTTDSTKDDSTNSTNKPKKQRWVQSWDFIITTSGVIVGYSNFYSFPSKVRSYGGSFVLIYSALVLLIGIPIFILEVALGQFSSQSAIPIFSRSMPLVGGLGWIMCFVNVLIMVSYPLNAAYPVFYFIHAMVDNAVWSRCDNNYNTHKCRDFKQYLSCHGRNGVYFNSTCSVNTANDSLDVSTPFNWCQLMTDIVFDVKRSFLQNKPDMPNPIREPYVENYLSFLVPQFCQDCESISQCSKYQPNQVEIDSLASTILYTESAMEHLQYAVLKLSDTETFSSIRSPNIQLTASILLVWVFMLTLKFFRVYTHCVFSYSIFCFRYCVLVVLIVFSLTLGEGYVGFVYMFSVNRRLLYSMDVWAAAAQELFYSLGLFTGILETLASFNDFHSNVITNCIFIVLIDYLTSIFAAVPVLMVFGYLAKLQQTDISRVFSRIKGFESFVAFMTGVQRFPRVFSIIMTCIVCLMLIFVGLDSFMASFETIITSIFDMSPELWPRRRCVLIIVSLLGIITSLMFSLGNIGFVLHWFIASHVTSYLTMVQGILCLLLVMNIYGFKRFSKDLAIMLADFRFVKSHNYHRCFSFYLRISLKFFSPLFIIIIVAYSYLTIAWRANSLLSVTVIASVSILFPLFFNIFYEGSMIYRTDLDDDESDLLSIRERIVFLCKPSPVWGPFLDSDRPGGRYPLLGIGITKRDYTERTTSTGFVM